MSHFKYFVMAHEKVAGQCTSREMALDEAALLNAAAYVRMVEIGDDGLETETDLQPGDSA